MYRKLEGGKKKGILRELRPPPQKKLMMDDR